MLTTWELKDYDYFCFEELSKKLNISPVLAKLLTQRGIHTYQQAQKFLFGTLDDLSSPFIMSGIEKAVVRIKEAIAKKEKVVIYGDYDVDGICSTVIMLECLLKQGLDVHYYVPDRFSEGYGLNKEAVENFASEGFSLVITVDCGIVSVEEVEYAKKLGIDFIITDHHNPADKLPPAISIINPKLDDCEQSKHLCGAGVAFNLAWALCFDILSKEEIFEWLDLVALATVADIVPLWGDNRLLVKYGLKQIENSKRTGLKALLAVSGLENKTISSWHIGFILAPRLNSAGRMDSASLSIELLLTDDYAKALGLAKHLDELNAKRKAVEDDILKQAVNYIETNVDLDKELVLVIGGENWHHGVIGIVASRLTDKYNRPVILISWEGEQGRGSGRSVDDFDLYKALKACDEYLLQFGGHKSAAGLTLERSKFFDFRNALLVYCTQFSTGTTYYIKQVIDLEIKTEEISQNLVEELKLLEPFGEGNPLPNFLYRGAEISNVSLVGKNKEHFKCRIYPANIDAIAFGKPELADSLFNLLKYDVVFNIDENEFLGRKSLQLKVRNLKPTLAPDRPEKVFRVKAKSVYDKVLEELNSNRPVVFVYPTFRTLHKHYLTLKQIFNPRLLKPLHGKIYIENRRKIEDEFAAGLKGIFLTSRVFLDYYQHKSLFPKNLTYMVDMWPKTEIKEEFSNNLKIDTLFGMTEIKLIRKQLDINKTKRAIVYANRPSTVKRLAKQFKYIMIETGETDFFYRNTLRQRFINSKQGVLLLDGSYDLYAGSIEDINQVIFADVPFSQYESLLVMNQISAGQDIEPIALFSETDIDKNKQYLEQSYPDLATIKQVLNFLKSFRTDYITDDINVLNSKMASFLKKTKETVNLLPFLWILADLGLCEVNKKGSIIAIKFIKVNNVVLDIYDSPYYLEGLAEKAAFMEWESMLTNG